MFDAHSSISNFDVSRVAGETTDAGVPDPDAVKWDAGRLFGRPGESSDKTETVAGGPRVPDPERGRYRGLKRTTFP